MSGQEREIETYEVVSASDREKMQKEFDEQKTLAEKQTMELFEEINGKFAQQVGTLSVHRQNDTNQLDFLERFPSDKFTDEESLLLYIKKHYGAGDYRIHGRVPGKKGIALNKLLTIGKTLEEMEDEKVKRRGGLPAVIPEGEKNQLMMLILEGQRDTKEMFRQMMEKKSTNLDFLKNPEILAILIPAATTLASSFMDSRKKNDPIAQLKNLMEIKELMGGDKKDEDKSVLESISEVAAGVLQNMQQGKAQQHQQIAAPRQADNPTGVSDAINRNESERINKWGVDDICEYLENTAYEVDINDPQVALETRDTLVNNASLESILEAVVYVDPEPYAVLKDAVHKHFGLPADLLEKIENARSEHWQDETPSHEGASTEDGGVSDSHSDGG